MSELQGMARFTFHEGKVEEFKRLSAQAMEIVRTKDAGTLQRRRTRRLSGGVLCPPGVGGGRYEPSAIAW